MQPPTSGSALPAALSRRGFLVVGGVLTTAVACSGPGKTTAPSRGASPTGVARTQAAIAAVDLDFENASLGPPITFYRGATLASAYAHTGSFGCRLAPTSANGNIACLVVDRSGFALYKPYASYTMFFRFETLPKAADTYMNLFEIGSTSTATAKSQFTVFFRNNRLTCDFASSETMDIAAMPSIGQWHLIQAIVHYGATTYTAHVKYDGGPARTLTSANDKTAQSVKVLWVHYPSVPVDHIVDVDDIRLATSDTLPGFLGP
jgi:hypothetical protein